MPPVPRAAARNRATPPAGPLTVSRLRSQSVYRGSGSKGLSALGGSGQSPALLPFSWSQVEQPGGIVDHDPGPPAIAAHGAEVLVPRVRHDLLIQRAGERGLGDQPGAQPVRRQPLGVGTVSFAAAARARRIL